MNKLVRTIAILIVGVTAGSAGLAQAASLQDVLDGVNKLQPALNQVEQLNQIQDQLKQGNRQALYTLLAQTALQKANINLPVDVTNMNKDSLLQVVREQVRQQALQKLGPYQNALSSLQSLDTLLHPSLGQAAATNEQQPILSAPPLSYKKILDMTATAYAPGAHDNGKWGNLNYAGGIVKKGIVAVDPNVIPMGSKLWVEGYGYAVADDQGSAIKGSRIDLAFNTLQEALDYGIQHVKVYVLE